VGYTDFGWGATDRANRRHLLPFLRAMTESEAQSARNYCGEQGYSAQD
jgi:hypothetical protein